MDRDRNRAQGIAGEHHHRLGAAAQVGDKLRMPRVLEAGGVEHGFLDGVGDHAGRSAFARQAYRALDGANNGSGVCRVRFARRHGCRQAFGKNGQGAGKDAFGLGWVGDHFDRNRKAETRRQAPKAVRVVDGKECADAFPRGRPGAQG